MYHFQPAKWHPKSAKSHNKPMFGSILGQDASKEALWIGLVGDKASLFISFASKYVAFTKFLSVAMLYWEHYFLRDLHSLNTKVSSPVAPPSAQKPPSAAVCAKHTWIKPFLVKRNLCFHCHVQSL